MNTTQTDLATLAETARYLVIHVGSRDSITTEPVTLRQALGLRVGQRSVALVVSVDDERVCHSMVRGHYIPAGAGHLQPGMSDEVAEIQYATR